MLEFNGMRIVGNPLLIKYGEPYEVNRSWMERLFSTPWRPLESKRTVVDKIPSDQILFIDGVYYAHPNVVAKLREVTNAKNNFNGRGFGLWKEHMG